MSLTYKQSKLVQETLPALREHGEQIASMFYATMLEEHPELKNQFNTVNQANGRQPRALTSIIIAFAANISHTSELIPKLERVCHKHCSLGIQPDQYAIVGEYLIKAFKAVLGPAMTPEVQAAWMDAYCVLARMMIGREAHLYRSFETWQTWERLKVDKKVAESEDVYSFYLVPVSASSKAAAASAAEFSGCPRASMSSVSSGGSRYSNFTSRLKTNNINLLRSSKANAAAAANSNSSSSTSVHTVPGGGSALPYYLPGQYVSVRMLLPEAPVIGRDGKMSQVSQHPQYYYQSRQYSLSDRWRPDCYRISVKRDEGTRFANAVAASYFHPGLVSNAMIDQLNVGDTIEVSHPTGEFFLNVDNAEAFGLPGAGTNCYYSGTSSNANVPLVLLSAGIGASPMMAILSSVAVTQPHRAVTYIHGSRYAPPVFHDTVRDLQRKMPRLRTAYFYSGPTPHASATSSMSSGMVGGGFAAAAAARRSRDVLHASANAHNNNNARNSTMFVPSPLGAHPTSYADAMPPSSPASSASTIEFMGHVDLRKLMTPPGTPRSEGTTTPTTPTSPSTLTIHSLHSSHGSGNGSSIDDGDMLFLNNGSTEYFVCGPESFMLDMAMHLVEELGVNRQRIRFELFSTGDLETDNRNARLATFLNA
ncbi:hypothetical protein SCUCBS95973_008411 [Sporothrix curviconia]|uniref:nitric oxide dioxygenase n=1 Tax=Sporothrix curviconia TaxID=1260050 RepID=A0ABP0CPG5_9PEZI